MFWLNFCDECARIGKSPSAVIKELGIAHGCITSWKKGVEPRNSTLKKIEDYFARTRSVSSLDELGHYSPAIPEDAILTGDERELIALYRVMTPMQRLRLGQYLEYLTSLPDEEE